MSARRPLTRTTFDAACRQLEALRPDLSCVSGTRTDARDAGLTRSGGLSKHRPRYAVARDYAADVPPAVGSPGAAALEAAARSCGLWALYHDAGSGPHLHVQGLPPGEAPAGWLSMHSSDPEQRAER